MSQATDIAMNKNLDKLLPYPFERLAVLLADSKPDPSKRPIRWSIGEPAHPAPEFVKQALIDNLDGLSKYPLTAGSDELRIAIAVWLKMRFSLKSIDADKNILPVNGTREALFSFAQAAVNGSPDALIGMPNPFYQIYEGAALMAGAQPYFFNLSAKDGFFPNFQNVDDSVWKRIQLLYVCSPSNPTGSCFSVEKWHEILSISKKFGFIVASDECYSELYFDEASPPVGLLTAAESFGLNDFAGCIVFHSLSKRSNLPGMRSGFVAGDAKIIEKYKLYRTYHGCAMAPPAQKASAVAWQDEQHVRENRKLYRQKFAAVLEVIERHIDVSCPQASFYLWPRVDIDDTIFAKRLYEEENLLVLPGSYIGRDHDGINPGKDRLRMALVAPLDECVEGAHRLRNFVERWR